MGENQVKIEFTGESAKLASETKKVEEGIDSVREGAKTAGEEGSQSLGLLQDILGGITSALAEASEAFKSLGRGIAEGFSPELAALASTEDRIKAVGVTIGEHLKGMAEKTAATAVAFRFFGAEVATAVGLALSGIATLALAYKSLHFAIGLVTGSSYKSTNIDALIAANKEVIDLQTNLGLSARDANALADALKRLGSTPEYMKEIKKKVTDTTQGTETENETARGELDRLGVVYKNKADQVIVASAVIKNAVAVLDTYTEGFDRNSAAVAMGLGTYAKLTSYIRMTTTETEKSKARLDEFNLGIGPESQAAIYSYSAAMLAFKNESRLMSEGFSRAIADNIMPAFTDLANFFKDGWPSVVGAFRYSMASITSLLWGLKTSADIVVDTIKMGFGSVSDILIGVAKAALLAATGDFSGAKDALIQGWQDAKGRVAKSGAEIVADAKHNAAAMKLAWAFDDRKDPSSGKPKKGKSWTAKPDAPEDEPELVVRDDASMWVSAHMKYLEYLRAFTATQIEIEKAAVAYDLEINQERYDTGLIDLQAFLSKRENLLENSIQKEIDLKEKELAVYAAEVAKGSKADDPKSANAYHEALIKLENAKRELIALEAKWTDTRLKGSAEAVKATGQEDTLAFAHMQKMADINATGTENALRNLGKEREAQEFHYQWQQDQLDIQNAYDQQSTILTIEQKLAKQREYVEKSLQIQQGYAQAMLPYGDFFAGMSKGLNSFIDTAGQTFRQGVDLAQQTAQGMQQAFSDFFFDAFQGKMKSLGDYIKSFLSSVQRAIANVMAQNMAQGITGAIGNYFSSGSASTNGKAPLGLDASTLVAHDGGMIVPRFHFGGLASDEVPAILQTRERVLSREQAGLFEKFVNKTEGGGNGNVQVNVINQSGQQVQAEQQGAPRFDGEQMIVNVVLKKLKSDPGFRNAMATGGAY